MTICDKTTNNNYERSLTQLSHNHQKYISLTLLRTLEKLCKKRDHGMVDLQPILTETLKQDSSRHQVWNIDKLYKRRNMCIKREKKKHMWDKVENTHHHKYRKKNTMYVKMVTRPRYMNWEKIHQNLTTSLKAVSPYLVYPMLAFPLTQWLLLYTKLLPLFVTNDKGCITERSSTYHH